MSTESPARPFRRRMAPAVAHALALGSMGSLSLFAGVACSPSGEGGAASASTAPKSTAPASTAPKSSPPATQPPPPPRPAASAEAGEALYARYCALCHGPRAEGYGADNAPSLVSSTFAATVTDDFLRAGITLGRPGTAMAGFGREVGGPLDEVGVDSIIAFIRTLHTVPRMAPPPFTAMSDAENGRLVYEKHCQKCHGTVTQRANAVHLFNPALLATASDAFLRHAVVNGRPDTPMEAFSPVLDGRATNDVITYIRSQAGKLPPLSSLHAPAPAPAEALDPHHGHDHGPVGGPPPGAPPVPAWGPIPLNPQGGAPKFTLRDGRFAPMAEVKKALDEKKKIIIVDARAPSDWLTLHIPGSVPLPYYDLKLIDRIPNDDTWVIAYCGCPHHASGEVVDALRRRGHKNSAVLDEGMFAWQKANYPVVQAPGMAGIAAPPVYDTHGMPQPMPSGPGPGTKRGK